MAWQSQFHGCAGSNARPVDASSGDESYRRHLKRDLAHPRCADRLPETVVTGAQWLTAGVTGWEGWGSKRALAFFHGAAQSAAVLAAP